jgi:hypothetical protein
VLKGVWKATARGAPRSRKRSNTTRWIWVLGEERRFMQSGIYVEGWVKDEALVRWSESQKIPRDEPTH